MRLRNESSSRLLWADGLFIDQSDAQERAQQVRLMRQIYAKARSVLIDLGEVDEREKMLLDCLCEVDGISTKDWAAATAKFNYQIVFDSSGRSTVNAGAILPWIQSNVASARSAIWRTLLGLGPPSWEVLFDNPEVWTGLKRFLERPWFSRLWVIQEFAMARRVEILIGSSSKPEKFLNSTLSRLRTHNLYLSHNTDLIRNLAKEDVVSHTFLRHNELLQQILAIHYRFASGDNPFSTFVEVFSQVHLASCSDSRDKVYGILGLVEPGEAAEICIDYTEQADNLALRISKHLVQHGKGLWMLYNASGCTSNGLSWAISLLYRTKQDNLASLVPLEPAAEDMAYYACGSSKPFLLCDESTGKLLTKGYILDRLSDLTVTLVDSIESNVAQRRLQWQLQAVDWVAKHKVRQPFVVPKEIQPRTYRHDNLTRQLAVNYYQAQEAANDAFEIACWTTAVADCFFHDGQRARRDRNDPIIRSYIQAFKVYLHDYLVEHTETRRDALEAKLQEHLHAARPYLGSLFMAYNRRLGITEGRVPCLLPDAAQIGDIVAILLGFPLPFVLRRYGDDWRLVGCCYVHGLMDGEASQTGLTVEDLHIC